MNVCTYEWIVPNILDEDHMMKTQYCFSISNFVYKHKVKLFHAVDVAGVWFKHYHLEVHTTWGWRRYSLWTSANDPINPFCNLLPNFPNVKKYRHGYRYLRWYMRNFQIKSDNLTTDKSLYSQVEKWPFYQNFR